MNEKVEQYWRARQDIERPIIDELAEFGYEVKYVQLLRVNYEDYSSALPILLKHLIQGYPDDVSEDIARSFATSRAEPYWNELVALYKSVDSTEKPNTADGFAVAICEIAKKSKQSNKLAEIANLLRDKSRGGSRLLLLDAVRRKRDAESIHLINELRKDPDLEKEIKSWKR